MACSQNDGNGGPLASGGAASGGSAQSSGGSLNSSGGAANSGGAALGSGGKTASASGGNTTASGGATATSGGASSGGAASSGAAGQATTGGSGGGSSAGASGGPSAGSSNAGELGNGMMMGSGTSDMRYETASVSRDSVPYYLITNGWGPGFQNHTVSWNGTSFTVESMNGTPGSGGQPASYPSVFCGKYSVMQVPDCGLPAAIDSLKALHTGWRWNANGNTGQYNAAYDIWIGSGTQLQGYLMVWLRDPPGQQPAGSLNMMYQGISVTGLPGTWNIWNGMVNRLPITNYVRAEGSDSSEIEFDVLDVIKDATMRNLMVPGTQVNAVAVGFEIWQGPITNLQSLDFYVNAQK